MSRATPGMRLLAERLIAWETQHDESKGRKIPIPFRVCEKMRTDLATLLGKGGFHALLSRALAIARTEVDCLCTVALSEEGMLEGSEKVFEKVEAKALAEGGLVLVAQLLGLLVAFIGQNLTLQLLRELWPKLSLTDFDSAKGDKS